MECINYEHTVQSSNSLITLDGTEHTAVLVCLSFATESGILKTFGKTMQWRGGGGEESGSVANQHFLLFPLFSIIQENITSICMDGFRNNLTQLPS